MVHHLICWDEEALLKIEDAIVPGAKVEISPSLMGQLPSRQLGCDRSPAVACPGMGNRKNHYADDNQRDPTRGPVWVILF